MGRPRGGLTTKIHLATDTWGRPLRVILTPGQAGDVPQAPALLDGFRPAHVLADKAYDSNAFRTLIKDIGATAVIPCNPTRKRLIPYSCEVYKARNRIERCFNKLKHFRRIATRYDRRAIDLGIADGVIAAIEPSLAGDGKILDLGGALITAGLVETHIHLDKSRILD